MGIYSALHGNLLIEAGQIDGMPAAAAVTQVFGVCTEEYVGHVGVEATFLNIFESF